MKKPSLAFADSNQGGLKFLLQAKGIQLNYSRKMYARYSFRKLANDSAFIAWWYLIPFLARAPLICLESFLQSQQ